MSVGRKKIFNEDDALRAALEVFWQKGYTGSSLSELLSKMGISKPSMYNTFGNKEDLFIKATEMYTKHRKEVAMTMLFDHSKPILERLEEYMKAVVHAQSCYDDHKGCLLVLGLSESAGGGIPSKASKIVHELGDFNRKFFIELFTNDEEAIRLKLNENAESKALSLVNTLCGTSCLTRVGFSLEQLEIVIHNSIKGIL
jgi:AcrR family transcriptional regulator